jgi:hypothetical protein
MNVVKILKLKIMMVKALILAENPKNGGKPPKDKRIIEKFIFFVVFQSDKLICVVKFKLE